jgi:hypothetical protein
MSPPAGQRHDEDQTLAMEAPLKHVASEEETEMKKRTSSIIVPRQMANLSSCPRHAPCRDFCFHLFPYGPLRMYTYTTRNLPPIQSRTTLATGTHSARHAH